LIEYYNLSAIFFEENRQITFSSYVSEPLLSKQWVKGGLPESEFTVLEALFFSPVN